MGDQDKSRLQRICNIAKYVVLAGIVIAGLILAGLVCLGAMMLNDPSLAFEYMGRDELFFLIVTNSINQVVSILLFFFLYRLTKSLGSEGSPFTSDNVWLLKKMAIILFCGWVFALIVDSILAYTWSVEYAGINADALLMAGIIYVISLVFEYGVRLQEESDSFV